MSLSTSSSVTSIVCPCNGMALITKVISSRLNKYRWIIYPRILWANYVKLEALQSKITVDTYMMTPSNAVERCLPKLTACGCVRFHLHSAELHSDLTSQGRWPSSWPFGSKPENLRTLSSTLPYDQTKHILAILLLLYSDQESNIKACSVSIIGMWATEDNMVYGCSNKYTNKKDFEMSLLSHCLSMSQQHYATLEQ